MKEGCSREYFSFLAASFFSYLKLKAMKNFRVAIRRSYLSVILLLLALVCYLLYPLEIPALSSESAIEIDRYVHSVPCTVQMPDTATDFLCFLDEELKNKQILLLGEQLHQDGATLQMKTRMVRYLHEKLGYNVILYETGLYDMYLMNQDGRQRMNPSKAVWTFWWGSNETKSLWEYYRSHPSIALDGFDCQLTNYGQGRKHMESVEKYLNGYSSSLSDFPYVQRFFLQMSEFNGNWNYFGYRLDRMLKDSIVQDFNKLENRIHEESRYSMEDGLHQRYIAGLKLRYESIWKYRNVGDLTRMNLRESIMADNLTWLVDSVYKDQKVIVWCANVHVFNRGRMQVDSTRFTSMGQRLKIHFGDRMYTIAFTSYARRNTDGGIRDPLSTLSLEYLLHQRKVGFAYLNFNELPVDSRWRQAFISGLDQGASLSEVWSEQMDMLFYIDLNYDVYYDKTFINKMYKWAK